MNKERIVRRSLSSPRIRPADWSEFDAQTDADIAAAVKSDHDAAPLVDAEWLETARIVEPVTKQAVSIRLDRDVLDWFRANNTRYQSKINSVLRVYMEHERAKRA